MALDDELPLPSPLPSPLSSLAAGLSASNASLSTLAAGLGLPPPQANGHGGVDRGVSDSSVLDSAAPAVAPLPNGTSQHGVAAAHGAAAPPPAAPSQSASVSASASSGGVASSSTPGPLGVHPYDFSGFASTLLHLIGAVTSPSDPRAVLTEPPVDDPVGAAAAMAMATPSGAIVVPTRYGGFCIVRGLSVAGGISALSHTVSAIRLALPDVRDALKVDLVQAMLDDAAEGALFRPLGSRRRSRCYRPCGCTSARSGSGCSSACSGSGCEFGWARP